MKRFLSRWLQPKPAEPVARTAEATRIYAIGDIHGRLDLFEQILALIEQDMAVNATSAAMQLVLLGDYVDRGLQSSEVVDRILALRNDMPNLTCLKGNHEDVLLQVAMGVADEDMIASWLGYGGRETLASYGISSRILYSDDIATIADLARQVIPDSHREFLRHLPLYHENGDYFFVHAGVHPARTLTAQRDHDLMWIREPFLSWKEDFGKTVVHGHSISTNVETRTNRIGIDTGAYATGKLTAIILEENTRRFLETAI
jgi:serine/threonine protein phosphatase 1